MRNRKITLLGPEGTNISIFFLFLVFNFISWFTLFTLSSDINLDFDEPLDYVEPKKEPEEKMEAENEIIKRQEKRSVQSYSKTAKTGVFVPFSGVGYKLGNK